MGVMSMTPDLLQPSAFPAFDQTTSRLRLQTIIRLRWLAVIGQTATVTAVYWGLGFDLPIGLCLLVIALSAWLNIFLRIRFPASHRLKTRYAALMLGYDTLQLAVLLYLTGGLQNPFGLLIVVPVTVSASTLPPRLTILLGVIAIVAATLLTHFYLPLPWTEPGTLTLPFQYVTGIWVADISGIVFIALYAWRIAKEARQMSDALTATELVLAREHRLSALDGLAAAAAHELGTPLSTITVVAKELLRELPEDSPNRDDVTLLHTQAQRCREILSTLTRREGAQDAMFASVPLTHLLAEVAEPHRDIGIEIEVRARPSEEGDDSAAEPVSPRHPGVLYGLGNLIENAVDFADESVEIDADWDQSTVTVRVWDDGPGFEPGVLEHIGEPYVTTRPARQGSNGDDGEPMGLGLGFFIAKTLLERSGAHIVAANRASPNKGAVITVIWPRAEMDVPTA